MKLLRPLAAAAAFFLAFAVPGHAGVGEPPSTGAPEERPSPVERTYEERQGKVWKAVIKAIREAGIETEVADRDAGYIKTKLMQFDNKRFRDVATPPPSISKERPLRQWIRLSWGRFSIEVAIRSSDKGTAVTLQAYIEERATDLTTQERLWVERYSNGTIEKYFIELFDKALQ